MTVNLSRGDAGTSLIKSKPLITRMGAASPIALLVAKMLPVSIMGRALGRTMDLITSHLVAPKAYPPNLRSSGTAFRASSAETVTRGRVRNASTIAPTRMLLPSPSTYDKNPRPTTPNITDGTPARLFRLICRKDLSFSIPEYSLR